MGLLLVHLLATYALLQVVSGSGDNSNLGIIGGKEVSIEDAPYMAAIYSSYDNHTYHGHCGGSIVHRRFILTAYHCVLGDDRANITSRAVLVGRNDLVGNKGYLRAVEKALCYDGRNQYAVNDICLLKLRYPVPIGKKVHLVQLPNKDTELAGGTKVNVTGWGKTSDSLDASTAAILRQVTIPTLSRESCLDVFDDSEINTFCAGATGRGACLGDSGSPLTYNNVQIGIAVTFQRNDTQTLCGLFPGLFVKVASYMDWINSTITNNL